VCFFLSVLVWFFLFMWGSLLGAVFFLVLWGCFWRGRLGSPEIRLPGAQKVTVLFPLSMNLWLDHLCRQAFPRVLLTVSSPPRPPPHSECPDNRPPPLFFHGFVNSPPSVDFPPSVSDRIPREFSHAGVVIPVGGLRGFSSPTQRGMTTSAENVNSLADIFLECLGLRTNPHILLF